MQQKFLLFAFVITILACKQPSDKLYMPGEWEPHEAVWLGWQGGNQSDFHPGIAALIKTLTTEVNVKIACDNDSLMQTARQFLFEQSGLDSSNITFYVMPGERYWIRDHGAAFLINEKGELGVADFDFRMYGLPVWLQEYAAGNDSLIQKRLKNIETSLTTTIDSQMAAATGARILKANIVHEGGSIEVNGKGTLILCEAVAMSRNPGKTKAELETAFKNALGVTHIIWMKEGLADDPNWSRQIAGRYYGWGTGGHTDEFVRFADPTTLLLAWVPEAEKDLNPVNRINYERMSENLRILEASRDQDGKPFNIIKVPLPDLHSTSLVVTNDMKGKDPELYTNAERYLPTERPAVGDTIQVVPASSYLNYLITNGLVLLPTYTAVGTSPQKEAAVAAIFKKLYPDRKIVFFDFMPQNWSGGGIHCSTQQEPKRRKG